MGNNAQTNLNTNTPKNSKVSEKIHIDGNSGWLDAKNSGLCTGEGTYSNPYVLKNFEIDSEGTGSCILIENSDVHFTIENCIVYNSGPSFEDGGIELNNVKNGRLLNNRASCNLIGIFLDYCYNNTIVGNTCYAVGASGDMGIKLLHTTNNTIFFNNFINYAFWYSEHNHWNSQKKVTYEYNGNTYTNYLGNHFEDYYETDSNNDGIGENPVHYDIQGGTIILPLDFYPLVEPIENYEYEFKPSDVINALLTITSPLEGSELTAGLQFTITWTLTNTISDVMIALYNGNDIVETITTSTENDGSYEWTLGFYEPGPIYRIYIQEVNNEMVRAYSEYFEITAAVPGYNLFILISAICLVSTILFKKLRKLIISS
jgi:parallel beta-helix repeat protein